MLLVPQVHKSNASRGRYHCLFHRAQPADVLQVICFTSNSTRLSGGQVKQCRSMHAMAPAGAHMRRESTIMRCVTGWLPDTVLPQPEKLSSCTYCAVSVM